MTPILELIEEPPTPKSDKWSKWLGLAIGGCIGVFLAATGIDNLPVPGFNYLVWLPALYVMIAIHELGHLMAGMLTGMAPGGLVVGGFRLMKLGDRWKFRFNWRSLFAGGMAIPLPRRGEFDIAGFAWFTVAGPIASVVSTLVCWLAYTKYGDGTWDWIGSCFWAAIVGLSSLIPMSAGINRSDAAVLWSLWKRPEESRAWMASVAVQAESMKGARPSDWDAALIQQMTSSALTGPGKVFPELMAYYRCLDGGSEPEALAHLENAIASSKKAGKVVRQVLFFEAAEVNALLLHNAVNARVWLERAKKLMKPRSAACAQGAVAIAESRWDDALRDIAAARAFLAKVGGDSGLARFAKERLDRREQTCRNGLSSNPATASASA